LIADALLARKIPVEHILSGSRRQPHEFTPFAKVRGTDVTYPDAKASEVSSKKFGTQLKLT